MSYLSNVSYESDRNSMTQTTPGNALALPDDFATGLEDFDTSDLRMPRLGIDHDKGRFVDSLSGAEFLELHIIPLGMIKQRVLWKPTIEEGDSTPLCKSPDSKIGFPTITMRNPVDNFPWPAVGLQQTDIHPNAEGRLTLPCESCRLKEWKSHPDGRKTWCTEQHAIPLIYGEPGTTPYMTALFTTQRSSIKSSQTFFASIVRRQLPAFAVMATLGLQGLQRGKNTYYIPQFKEWALTDQADWPAYSDTYRQVRSFISQVPALKDADGNIIDPNAIGQENTIQGQVVMASAGHPQYGPTGQVDPWNQPAPQQAWPPQQTYQPPVQPQYAQQQPAPQQYQQPYQPPAQPQYQAPPAPPAPQQAPVQQVAPPAPIPSAPASPPPVSQPQAAQAVIQPTPVAAASSRQDDDDLPF